MGYEEKGYEGNEYVEKEIGNQDEEGGGTKEPESKDAGGD